MKPGKKFEKQIKDSVPRDVYFYRFRDGTASWEQSSENVRFQQSNICDCMIYKHPSLFLLELKSYSGKSFPLSGVRGEQLKGLVEATRYSGIVAGLLINMRDVGKCYFLDINIIADYHVYSTKKSINIQEMSEYGVEIIGTKKRVNYKWDLSSLWTVR